MTMARTECACDACTACCKRQPGYLRPGDFERIAGALGKGYTEASELFRSSPGAVVANTATGRAFRIGTITPATVNGRCVFLDEHDRCKIHEVAPFGCAYFDTHMGEPEALRRSREGLAKVASDADYHVLRARLHPATSWRPRAYTREGAED